jgi:plastocyanin
MTHRKTRLALAVFVAVLLAGSACSSKDKTTTTNTTAGAAGTSSTTEAASTDLTIKVGNLDEANLGVDYLAFYPTSLQAAQGETIRFTNPTKGTPHTVTFGIAADHSNQPALIANGTFAAISGGPCISTTPVKASDTTCPGSPSGSSTTSTTASSTTTSARGGASSTTAAAAPPKEVNPPAAFAGQAFFNTGVFVGGQTAVLKVDPTTKAGTYSFICLLHPTMTGQLTVVDKGTKVQPATDLAAAGKTQVDADKAEAAKVASSVTPPGAGQVLAGAVGKEVSVNQFFPTSTTVKLGSSVTWKDDSFEPHTITFGRVLGPEDPEVFGPPIGGASYDGTFAFSGLIGGKPLPASSYTLKFPKAGSFSYTCSIHPGMAGVVVVQ